ncbi:MAG: hypothetical protein ABR507_00985 [Actinomycetota bacterium]
MSERDNEKVIERLIECINAKKVQVMDELFHDDAVMDWPQSGESVKGPTTAVLSTARSLSCPPSRRAAW